MLFRKKKKIHRGFCIIKGVGEADMGQRHGSLGDFAYLSEARVRDSPLDLI
jgi:hypothetical protein